MSNLKIGGKVYEINSTVEIKTDVSIRVRGEQRRVFRITSESKKGLAEFFARICTYSDDAEKFRRLLKKDSQLLREIGVLIPKSRNPTQISPDNFLNVDLLDFVNRRHRMEYHSKSKKLRWNSKHVFFQNGFDRPTVPFAGIPPSAHFPAGPRLVWVFDPGTHMWMFYRIGPDVQPVLDSLASGKLKIESLDEGIREMLFHCRILVTSDFIKQRRKQWVTFKKNSKKVIFDGWAVAKNVLPPFQIALCRKYFRDLYQEGYYFTDDRFKDKLRDYCSNDPLCGYLGRQGNTLIRHMSGQAIFPSWSMLSRYRQNSVLERHIDRDQCGWNASMPIDSEGAQFVPWPLYVEDKRGRSQKILLEIGDLAIYSGSTMPHWRQKLRAKRTDTVMLWFYVPVSFTGEVSNELP